MHRLFKRWWLLVAAMMTAIAVVLAGTLPAHAAEPGEGSSWNNESVNNGATLNTTDTYSEARGDNGFVQIWRGLDNHVWLAVNNGRVFAAGTNPLNNTNTTETNVAPRVVWSDGWFYAFHTGTDNRIYWSRASDNLIGAGTPSFSLGINWSAWTAISGDPATTESVSVAADTENGSGILMTWLGVGQTTMYSAWLPSGSDVFQATQVITNANGNSAPVVTFNPNANVFVLAFRGLLDNRVYLMGQVLGQSSWSLPEVVPGITTPTSPTVAVDFMGNTLISAVDFNGNIWFQAINAQHQTNGWREESTLEQTGHPVWISIIGDVFYIVATFGISATVSIAQWKAAWNADKGI
jgi:hypothetical protein